MYLPLYSIFDFVPVVVFFSLWATKRRWARRIKRSVKAATVGPGGTVGGPARNETALQALIGKLGRQNRDRWHLLGSPSNKALL